jgi:hypothetical protein
MAVVAFDTLKLADRLEAGGFTAAQARTAASAFADAMSGSDLATKADLGEAKAELKADLGKVKADLVDVEHRLETQIAAVRTDLVDVEHRLETRISAVSAALAEVKAELKADSRQMELRMTIKLGGMLAAGIAIVATVVKLIH